MLGKLFLSTGPNGREKPIEFITTPITLIVGPNGSGKSLFLRELLDSWKADPVPSPKCIIRACATQMLDEQALIDIAGPLLGGMEKLDQRTMRSIQGEVPGNSPSQSPQITFHWNELVREFKYDHTLSQSDQSRFVRTFALHLDAHRRFNIIENRPLGNLGEKPDNLFSLLFRDEERLSLVQDTIRRYTGKYLWLDHTSQLGHLSLGFSESPWRLDSDRLSLASNVIEFNRALLRPNYWSDGLKAFVGLLLPLLMDFAGIYVIDEPEAFLQPAWSQAVGHEFGKRLLGSPRRLFAATHSSEFVMGCILSGCPTSVLRLDFDGKQGYARLLPSSMIEDIIRVPLLRNTGVVRALFYAYSVVTEADRDRSFYQEINHRLVAEDDPGGLSNTCFMNAQNKQTVRLIVGLLRKLGIPSAAIVDIDFVKEGGDAFSKTLEACGVPDDTRLNLCDLRTRIYRRFELTGKDMKKEGAEGLLEGDELRSYMDFSQRLGEYGIFLVDVGEVECWLRSVHTGSKKNEWLGKIFDAMGSNPSEPGYVRPSSGDVWDFMRRVAAWLRAPNRKGMQ